MKSVYQCYLKRLLRLKCKIRTARMTALACHGRHVGAPKQRNGGHLGVPTKPSGNLTLLLCKRFLLFSLKNMAVDRMSKKQHDGLFNHHVE